MDTKRAEIMATARTQDTDSRCHNVCRGIGKRLKRKGAKQFVNIFNTRTAARRDNDATDLLHPGPDNQHPDLLGRVVRLPW